jgi:hypothetical protein
MPKRKKVRSLKPSPGELIPALRAAIRVADQAMTRVKSKRASSKRPKR